MVEAVTHPDTGPRGTDFKPRRKSRKSKNHQSTPDSSNTSKVGTIRVIQVRSSEQLNQVSVFLACPQCGAKVSSKAGRLEKHIGKVHCSSEVVKPFRQSSEGLSDVVNSRPKLLHSCSVCGAQVKSLAKHAKRTGHRAKANLAGTTSQRSRRQNLGNSANQTKCPICRAAFPNATQLASHVAGSHGRKALRNLDHEPHKSSRTSWDASPASSNTEELINMDAKFAWGNSFRDNGQFGSYPSHDAMDDESSP